MQQPTQQQQAPQQQPVMQQQQPQPVQQQQQPVTPDTPDNQEVKKPAIPSITVRENKEGNFYLVATSLKGLGLEGLKEALAVTDHKIGNMNPKNFTFSFAMTEPVVNYLKNLPEGAAQYFPSLDAVLNAKNHVNFDNNVGWLDQTPDGGVNATIRLGYETLASGHAKEVSATLKDAGMKFNNLLVWHGAVTTDNVMALNSLGVEWAQDFQEITANVGAPEEKAPVQQQYAEPVAPSQQAPGM